MKTARATQYDAENLKIDGASACRNEIVKFVEGIRGRRSVPVTEKQIVAWFKATSPKFVREQLNQVCADGRVRVNMRSLSSHRRHNGAYVYTIRGDF